MCLKFTFYCRRHTVHFYHKDRQDMMLWEEMPLLKVSCGKCKLIWWAKRRVTIVTVVLLKCYRDCLKLQQSFFWDLIKFYGATSRKKELCLQNRDSCLRLTNPLDLWHTKWNYHLIKRVVIRQTTSSEWFGNEAVKFPRLPLWSWQWKSWLRRIENSECEVKLLSIVIAAESCLHSRQYLALSKDEQNPWLGQRNRLHTMT